MSVTWTEIKDMKFVLLLFSLIVSTFALASLIRSHQCNNRDHDIKSSVFTITYGCMVSYIIFDIMAMFQFWINDTITFQVWQCLLVAIWNLSQLLIYALLFLRLYHSFHGTLYAISNRTYSIFIGLCILYILSVIGQIVYRAIVIQNYIDNKGYNWNKDLAMGFQIGFELVDLVISILLISLFINKMMIVTMDLRMSQSDSRMSDKLSILSREQQTLLDVTSKYFILSFIATLWTQIVILIYLVNYVIFLYHEMTVKTYMMIYDIGDIFWFSDGIVNPICLFLIFEVNDGWYRRLCRGCHAFSKLCFKKCTMRNVKRRYGDVDKNNSMQLGLLNDE